MSEFDFDSIARPRTETRGYVFPPARRVTVPPADRCDREDLLDLAAGAAWHDDQLWALLGSREYVRSIMKLLVEVIEPEFDDALAENRSLKERLAAQALLVDQLKAERADLDRVRLELAFERASRTIVGASYDELRVTLDEAGTP